MNALRYFYQWTIKFDDRHKLIIISHRDQKQFNVCVISYKNSSSYVQRQTNLMLKNLRVFVKAYMNDIIIFFKILNDHFVHLRKIFQRLWHYNVALNSKKIFLRYLFIILLRQIINALRLITAKEKLVAIVNLVFSLTLKKLKKYLRLTEYLRVYVFWYAQTFNSLQKRKILILTDNLVKSKLRKIFSKRTSLNQSTKIEQRFYEHLQKMFSKESFLRHFDLNRKLFIDVDTSKKRKIDDMIFHVKENSNENIIFNKSNIELIMFLSKILASIKTRYWSTELKRIDVIWIVKKVRHLIKSFKKSLTIIFTNHFAIAEIIKQTFLISFNTNKLNLRLIQTSQYLFVLSIDIKIKFDKFHIISNVLLRLFSIVNKKKFVDNDDEIFEDLQYDINVMIIQSISELKTFSFDVRSIYVSDYLDVNFEQRECLIEMTNEYRRNLLHAYETNEQWTKIKKKLIIKKNSKNISNDMNFVFKKNLIYYASEDKTHKLCISWNMKKNIYHMTHDDNHHCDFHRAYARIFESLYIRHMFKKLRRYIHHCRFCLKEQTKRHSFYDELSFIKIMILFFHTMIIDFIVILFVSQRYDALSTTKNNFFKIINFTTEKEDWDASKWISI